MNTQRKKQRRDFVLVILIVILLSCMHISFVFNYVRNEVRNYQTRIADMNIQTLKERLHSDTKQLKILCSSLKNKKDGFWYTKEAQMLIEDFQKSSDFTEVDIADTEGNMYLVGGLESIDISNEEYFKFALEGKISMQSIVKEVDGQNIRRLNIGIPIYKENRVEGVLIGSYSIDALHELLPTGLSNKGINSFIVRNDGKIIINGSKRDEYVNIEDIWSSDKVDISERNYNIISKSVLDNKRGTVSYYIDGNKHYLISTPVIFSDIYARVGATKWNLLVDIPAYYIANKASKLLLENMIYSMSVLAIFILLSISVYKEKNREYKQAESNSRTDAVTGGYNRRALEQEFKKCISKKKQIAVCLIDLDNFKQINDRLGHLTGDDVLIRLAKILEKKAKEKRGFSGRLGGDEFLICIPSIDEKDAKNLADDIVQSFSLEFTEYCKNYHLGITIGISYSPKHGNNFYDLLRSADEALYIGKREGKMRATVAE